MSDMQHVYLLICTVGVINIHTDDILHPFIAKHIVRTPLLLHGPSMFAIKAKI